MRLTLLTSLLALSFIPQQAAEAPDPTRAGQPLAPREALSTWQEAHGASWRVIKDRQDGWAEMIHGGRVEAPFQPLADADWFDLARGYAEATSGLHGIVPETLRAVELDFLPLGQIGSTDKWNVKFVQELDGVPVDGGFLNVLLSEAGDLLSVQATAAPRFEDANTVPTQTEDSARDIALRLFEERTQAAGFADAPRLMFRRVDQGARQVPTLAWRVDVRPAGSASKPTAWRYWIEDRTGALLEARDLIQNFDVGGQITSMATPGTLPDTGANPETQQGVPNVRVTSSAGTVFADPNGNFNFPGVSGPLDVTVDYVGTWNDVRNQAGSDYTLTVPGLTGTGNVVLMNPSAQALVTAQANCYAGVNHSRDWIVSINPTDTTADFQAISNANLNSTCNAYYDGVSINMFQAGGGCVNTGYSTVVVHEYGHWLNDLYATGNGSDGMGEGNADIWAMYLYDDPIVGEDFCGSGCHIRTGNNTRPYCGDGNSACYGEVHDDGEPWMGAAWKIRERLKTTHGVSAGGLTADTLFLAWMNAYNQSLIDSIIEVQWLTLDDDDGNIDNGTTNYADIDGGFVAQGFPGYALALIDISGVTQLPDLPGSGGPFVVDANIVALVNPPIVTADLFYRVNGGAFTSVSMSPTVGDGYSATIPAQSAPAVVDYYVQATDVASQVVTSPRLAPADTLSFSLGGLATLFFDDFEGAGDNGWTHNTFGDTSNSQDDWQHDVPGGLAGDPSAAFSGSRAWGNDLGVSGFNGAYQNNVHNYLRSPSIDCSAASGTKLRFQRWLTVESGQWDQARVSVNGTVVWSNVVGADTVDTAWTQVEVDISALADGNPAVQLEFSLQTDTSVTFGGWTLDDVELLALTGGGFPDCNGNGVDDATDISSGTSQDCNANGVPDDCELLGNDCNANGVPDDCELGGNDCNVNGVPDECELAGNDCDANGVPDECDPDCDGSGVPDACEALADCNANGTPDVCEVITDCNANGVPDECELVGNDCNANGVPDDCELGGNDCNVNGVPDECELAGNDCDANGVPDECDEDCNANGTPDACEVLADCNANGTPDVCEVITDCNANGVPDECELAGNDCNANSVPDDCELVGNDCDANGVPDDCEADCNGNGTPDACEALVDCNLNGVPDECELVGNDCDANGIPDECDEDCNANGTPDACESLADCNANGTPDVCEVITDCNANGVPDDCELVGNDCDANGVPDECDEDCNVNGTPDACESLADCNANGTPDVCEVITDCNANGVPDECELAGSDCNVNGVPDDCELAGNDCDANGVPDECDVDCNANGLPDACESLEDCNGNGTPDECESLADCNANGTPDVCEVITDCNANGVPDECELVSNDCDANGVPDECDLDCNANGTPDACEVITDCNVNGVPDECELAGNDCDANGVPDECDLDCDGSGIPDACEALADCNANGTPDVCESFADCNSNGVPDECELAGNDCNLDGVPDDCEPDCNANGTPDGCEVFNDCNANNVPDECELAGNDCNANGVPDDCEVDCDANGVPDDCESHADCNANGVPDVCDLLAGTSMDANGNSIPDECDAGVAYCFGDGSGTACPCGNAGGPGEGCRNSTGAGAVLGAGGTRSAAADDLSMDASGLPGNTMILLFSGTTQLSGGAGVVFGDGLRCAGGDVKRHGVRVADGAGTASWGPGLAAQNGWTAADTRTFQGWYRDTVGSPCGANFNLTNGVLVDYLP